MARADDEKPDAAHSLNGIFNALQELTRDLPDPWRTLANGALRIAFACALLAIAIGIVVTFTKLNPLVTLYGVILIFSAGALALIVVIFRAVVHFQRRARITITFRSHLSIDDDALQTAFTRYGLRWPRQTIIIWPPSSEDLLAAIELALRNVGSANQSLEGASHFSQFASKAVMETRDGRKQAASKLLALVGKLGDLTPYERGAAARNFLIYANWKIHEGLGFNARWNGLEALGIAIPAAWDTLSRKPISNVLVELFGPTSWAGDVVQTRVFSIGAFHPPEGKLILYMPEDMAKQKVPSGLSLVEWLIPQLEWRESATNLPVHYDPNDEWKMTTDPWKIS